MAMATVGRARRKLYWLLIAIAWAFGCGSGAEPPETSVPQTASSQEPLDDRRVVLFLGTSLTAGYGLTSDEAFPTRLQQRIDAGELPYRVLNAGVSGDTSAGGLRRLDWLLRLPIAVLVLELGANDMLRGQGVEAMRANLQAVVDRLRGAHPEAQLLVAGMRATPNLGARYTSSFEASFREIAQRNDGALIPFLLEGVAANPGLNQADGIHPTSEGHRIIAATIWPFLRPLLR